MFALVVAGCGARTALPGETRAQAASVECRPNGNGKALPRVVLAGTLRDFHDTHPDFESFIGADPGIVEGVLGIDDEPVYAGQDGNPSTHGRDAFDQWYHDVAGVNESADGQITLSQASYSEPDVYGFRDDEFFPLDGELFGNEGREHNFHFTLELHGTFEYLGREVLDFTGDDDMWVFINRRLAIDLGGVHASESAAIDLDAHAAELGIERGEIVPLALFFAERHTTASTFDVELHDFVVCQ